ncbi:hypothetical protein SERLA73DRAFT_118571 [Serpula lacrymans var. lacrymans S7.3]|uniref:Uncharacterized protein n=1 Tax=Serpula lacrymans var. lacrymans (strain S7.3) TaxID=936435 RepID=F8PHT0_SERL3|nr:hypothetical protein SERLA73DRAFT_118571 [Serpula lacrymans var. lacrymans S7.3]
MHNMNMSGRKPASTNGTSLPRKRIDSVLSLPRTNNVMFLLLCSDPRKVSSISDIVCVLTCIC